MSDQFPVVFRDGKALVYRVSDVGLITDEFVRKIEWPEGVKACIFTFDRPIADEAALNARVTYSEDFSFHVRYGAEKEWLNSAVPAGDEVKAAELNARSLRFFRKLGFRPEAVHIYKER